MSEWVDELTCALLDGDPALARENILRVEAGRGIQKSANRLAVFIARNMVDAGVAMQELGLIPIDEPMPADNLIRTILKCVEDGTADRIWAEPRRGPKHPDPDLMWEVWGQVRVANLSMGLRPSHNSIGAFETVAQIRKDANTLPWQPDTIHKYYKTCQKVWRTATG